MRNAWLQELWLGVHLTVVQTHALPDASHYSDPVTVQTAATSVFCANAAMVCQSRRNLWSP